MLNFAFANNYEVYTMAESGFINKMEIDPNEARRLKLPTTRKQQFWDLLKTQLANIFKLNMLTILIGIPFLFLVFIMFPAVTEAIGAEFDFTGNIGIGYPGTVSDKINAEISVLMRTTPLMLMMIPAIGLLGIPFAGLMYVLRNMVWGESVSVGADYLKGIKSGWKQYLVVFFVLGFVISALLMVIRMFNIQSLQGTTDFFSTAAFILSIIGMLMIAGITLYLLPMMSMYNMKLRKMIRNAGLLSLAMFPMTIGIILLTALPFILGYLFGAQFMAIMIMALIFIGVAVLMLMWTVYVQYVLDKSVNKRANNVAYKRGIYVAKDENGEEIEESKEKKAVVQKRYVNPKKKKKAEPVMNTLRENYSRDDIKKYMEEKEKFFEEIDGETEEKDGENGEE